MDHHYFYPRIFHNYLFSITIFTVHHFVVIDVYSGWCGPCKAIISLFRRLKNELGDDILRFATVSTICTCTHVDTLTTCTSEF